MQNLSPQLTQSLQKLTKYEQRTFANLVVSRLKQPLQKQVQKIEGEQALQKRRDYKDQQLLIVVLNNHVKAILDLKNVSTYTQNIEYHSNVFINQSNIQQYQQLIQQFSQSNQEINRIVLVNRNFHEAVLAIEKMIQMATNRNYQVSIGKFAEVRLRLLEILYAVMKSMSESSSATNHKQQMPSESVQFKKGVFSFKDLQSNDMHLIIEELDQKVAELSTICQQIPQLQTFKRTLDLTMPEHNENFSKIVDVLIQLHHKINKLISRRPQKLLKQIENVEKQCLLIERTTSEFIQRLESQSETQIKVIYFDQKTNKSPEHFRNIQKNIVKISEHMIYCLNMQNQYEQRMLEIRSLIELFFKIINNLEQNYDKEWRKYRDNRDGQLGEEEEKIISILEECVKVVENHRIQFINTKENYEERINQLERQASKNVQYLEEEINNLNRENDQLKQMIDQYQKQRLNFRDQINELKRKYTQLSSRYQIQMNQHQQIVINLQTLSKNYQLQLQKQAAIIANLENQQNNNNSNKNFQNQLKKLQAQNDKLAKQLAQQKLARSQQNNKYLIQIQQLRTSFYDQNKKNSQKKQQKQQQLQETLVIKQQKITQLHTKVQQLNNKLNDMLKQFKDMQLQLKRRQHKQIQLNKKIQQFQFNSANDLQQKNKEIQAQFLKNQNDLNNALLELQKTKKIVGELEVQLRRRQTVINQMQIVINDLDNRIAILMGENGELKHHLDNNEAIFKKKITQLEQASQNCMKCKQYEINLRDLENRLRDLENQINHKDSEIKNLNAKLSINQVSPDTQRKISQLQSQVSSFKITIQNLNKQRDGANKKIHDLQGQISTLKLTIQTLNRQKDGPNRRIHELQNEISRLKMTIENLNRQRDGVNKKIHDLQSQISTFKNTIQTLNRQRDTPSQRVHELESSINNLNITIQNISRQRDQLSIKLRELQNQLGSLKITLQNINRQHKHKINQYEVIIQNLKNQLSIFQQKITTLEQQARQSNSNIINTKQLQYLKQKIRSLEQLIQIFTEEHAILQAKIKQYRLKQNKNIQIMNKYNVDFAQLQRLLEAKDKQIFELRNNSNSQSRQGNQQGELRMLENRLSEFQIRLEDQSRIWGHKQKNYIHEIQQLKLKLLKLQQERQNAGSAGNNSNKDQDKYYLRVDGQRLEQLIKMMESGSTAISGKVDQILSNSRRNINIQNRTETVTNQNFAILVQQNKILVEQIKRMIAEKREAASVMKSYPNPDFLTEFIFRVIIFFSELHPESSEGLAIWQQLTNIRNSYQGSQYFVVLQDFTKFYLEENTIQVYRRQLKVKAEELEALKARLDRFFEQKMQSEKYIYNKTILSQSRAKLFRQRYSNGSRVQNQTDFRQ